MATVTPTRATPSSADATVITWAGIVTGDTVVATELIESRGSVASVQIDGTFNGGTTAVLQVSNDGSTWFTAKDVLGTAVSATADAYFELSLAARYARMSVASGSSDSITAVLVLRG